MEKGFVDLPKNVVSYTLSFLDLSSIFKFSLSCKKASKIFKEESLWRMLHLRDVGEGEMGQQTWLERYKESLFKWNPKDLSEFFEISHNGRRVTTKKESCSAHRIDRPLQKNNIHKCEFLKSFFFLQKFIDCLSLNKVLILNKVLSGNNSCIGICSESCSMKDHICNQAKGRGMGLNGLCFMLLFSRIIFSNSFPKKRIHWLFSRRRKRKTRVL
jgi:hypothetical protein